MASSSQMLRALRGAWQSAREAVFFSSTVVRRRTGTHLHRIGRYSAVDAMSQTLPGLSVDSPKFRAGGRRWELRYYPNGVLPSQAGHVFVYLRLLGAPWWSIFYQSSSVTAAYNVSILGGRGGSHRPALISREFGPRSFSSGSLCNDAEKLATVEELRSALRRRKGEDEEDGELVVRCEVTVMELVEESRIRWYLRQLAQQVKLHISKLEP